MTTSHDLDERFRAALAAWSALPAGPGLTGDPQATVRSDSPLTGVQALELFDAQLTSRHLDLAALALRAAGEGFHTIGSSGHEGNAAVAAALRPTDPALLHYRSGAFYAVRAGQFADSKADPVRDILRGVTASSAEPIAGGRHKVFGHPDLHIIPTTSTIASHLPRALGMAFAVERFRRAGEASRRTGIRPGGIPGAGVAGAPGRDLAHAGASGGVWPRDAVVACSFGDASINHASALAAFNTAGWSDFTGLRLPLLFVCEDNGLGISVRSPAGWVGATLSAKPGLRYFHADGCDLAETYAMAHSAVSWVRRHRRPAVLHLRTVRLMGHAGADAEQAYRTTAEIEHDRALDPLLGTARLLVDAGLASPAELLARYDEIGWQVRQVAEQVRHEPKLSSAAEIVAPLAPRRPLRVASTVTVTGERAAGPLAAERASLFEGRLPEDSGRLTLAGAINATLTDLMLSHPQSLVFGQDVGRKGGVHGVTRGLRDRFGPSRVFDTLLDETSILGLAAGAGLGGLLPIPEIQYLAYLHNAEDQLRGEAATMRFFSQGAFRNPMVVRVAGLSDIAGFGGQAVQDWGHNDNSVAVLRDIPGLVIAAPCRPDDAAAMLRSCVAAAQVDGTVSVFLEPIALYHTRDLHREGDGLWTAQYPGPQRWGETHVPVGRARVYGFGAADELTILTFGNGVPMSLRVASRLADAGHGIRVVDLRWLAPLPLADLVREANATGRVLVVDETRRTGGVAEGVLASLVDAGYVGLARRVAAVDSFLPLGPATAHILVTEESIASAAGALLAA